MELISTLKKASPIYGDAFFNEAYLVFSKF